MQIGYLTSDDGLNWTATSPDPVLMTKDVPYAKVAIGASDGTVLDDGTWVLYFYTWNSYSQTTAPGAIGRATAPAPTGPWTPDPAPVLNPGSAGSWDELMVGSPRIVKTNDGYRMYYTGYDQDRPVIRQNRPGDLARWHHLDEIRRSRHYRRALRRKRPDHGCAAGANFHQSADGRTDTRRLGDDLPPSRIGQQRQRRCR